jgi:hypothetical protein
LTFKRSSTATIRFADHLDMASDISEPAQCDINHEYHGQIGQSKQENSFHTVLVTVIKTSDAVMFSLCLRR